MSEASPGVSGAVAPGAEPAVRLEGVSRRFGWTWALRSVDLVVPRGELLAVVGPNGAGKTTLLRLLATLLEPSAGRVRVLGRDPTDESLAVRRSVGLLAGDDYLYDDLTGRENLRFAALMSGRRDWEGPADDALERTGLTRFADRRVAAFSSGMRKRLAVARLLLRPPELVLLDEPYASLDARGMELVDELVDEMRADGRTVLVASHRWGRSLREADRVAVLEEGRLARVASPTELAPPEELGVPGDLGPPGEHAPPGAPPADGGG